LKFKLVIFDFDGTLADTLAWFIGISDRLADEFGLDRIDKDQVATLRRHDAATLLRLHHVPLWKVPFIAARFRSLMAKQIETIAPFPGVPDLLVRLAQAGSTLAVVTSNSSSNVRRVLGKKSMGLMAACEGGVSVFGKRSKLRKVLRHTGIHPAQAIFIGDEIRDIEAARHAGIASGAVAWGFTDMDALRAHSPDMLFTTVDEMLQALVG
jgi:phosphoglycolate phosphatase